MRFIINSVMVYTRQPRKPGSFTSARRYSKDPGSLWSREPPDFRGNSNCRLFAIQGGVVGGIQERKQKHL